MCFLAGKVSTRTNTAGLRGNSVYFSGKHALKLSLEEMKEAAMIYW